MDIFPSFGEPERIAEGFFIILLGLNGLTAWLAVFILRRYLRRKEEKLHFVWFIIYVGGVLIVVNILIIGALLGVVSTMLGMGSVTELFGK